MRLSASSLWNALLAASVLSPAIASHAAEKSTYINPVIASNFPDPAVLREPDGTYYAFATNSGRPMQNIQRASSRDLVHWTLLGDALPAKPSWASNRQKFWAPDVHRHGDTIFMYFAAEPNDSVPGKSSMCIGVATAKHAADPFVDTGAPLMCDAGFTDIDPFQFDDPKTGRKLIFWGSDRSPLRVQELTGDYAHLKPGSTPIEVMQPAPPPASQGYRKLVEGSWVTLHNGWYYLYFSGDNCCFPGAHYAVMVARSRSATGPYELKPDDGVILSMSPEWQAPGHNSIATDDAGHEWMLYHAIEADAAARQQTLRSMLIDRITYRDGWPVINDGMPSRTSVPAPVIRKSFLLPYP